MFFNIKSAVLFGLVAISAASPIAAPEAEADANALVARAQVPASIKCNDVTWTKAQINDAIAKSKAQNQKASYPKKFGNKNGGKKVFPNIDEKKTQLWEYPLTNPQFNSGSKASDAGKVRVVMNDKYAYVGLMNHVAGLSNGYTKC